MCETAGFIFIFDNVSTGTELACLGPGGSKYGLKNVNPERSVSEFSQIEKFQYCYF